MIKITGKKLKIRSNHKWYVENKRMTATALSYYCTSRLAQSSSHQPLSTPQLAVPALWKGFSSFRASTNSTELSWGEVMDFPVS